MSITDRSKRLIAGGAAAVGLTFGVAALAGAATSPDQIAPSPPSAEADGDQDPMLNGSIQAPDDESLSEANEAKSLEGLATISPADAEAAAAFAVPGGTAESVELGNENGSVAYEVEVTDASGQEIEVKVDAGNGDVLATENESDETDEAEEGGDEPEVAPAG